jgi:transposase
VTQPSDLPTADKDALIASLIALNEALTVEVTRLAARVAELEARLGLPPKTPGNSSVPPSKGQKPSGSSTPKAKSAAIPRPPSGFSPAYCRSRA